MEDYEELMLQISDVMREANRIIPDLSHEQAVKNIRGIVERHGKWYYNYQNGWHCSICNKSVKDMPTVMGKADFNFCPNCGARMER